MLGLKTVYSDFDRNDVQCSLKQGTSACDNFAFSRTLSLLSLEAIMVKIRYLEVLEYSHR